MTKNRTYSLFGFWSYNDVYVTVSMYCHTLTIIRLSLLSQSFIPLFSEKNYKMIRKRQGFTWVWRKNEWYYSLLLLSPFLFLNLVFSPFISLFLLSFSLSFSLFLFPSFFPFFPLSLMRTQVQSMHVLGTKLCACIVDFWSLGGVSHQAINGLWWLMVVG